MTTWTPEQRRAYAIKKRIAAASAKRMHGVYSAPDPQQPVGGFDHHPGRHPCGVYDIQGRSWGSECNACGRRWIIEDGFHDAEGIWRDRAGTRNYRVIPVTRGMPDVIEGERPTSSTTYVELPAGILGEMPPLHLRGAARGAWWKDYAAERAKTLASH